MSFFSRDRLFQKAAVMIFWSYGILMILVLMVGLIRPNGGTGMDSSQIVRTRHQVNEEKLQARNKLLETQTSNPEY